MVIAEDDVPHKCQTKPAYFPAPLELIQESSIASACDVRNYSDFAYVVYGYSELW